MSNSDPPSRIPPRGQGHESKAAREEISSKGKVEKVREVDADETRKRKFQKYMSDDATETEPKEHPTVFDLHAKKSPTPKEEGGIRSSRKKPDEDVEAPPPVPARPPENSPTGEDEEAAEGALPQSEEFWDEVDFPPDKPTPPPSFQETPRSMNRPAAPAKGKAPSTEKKEPSPFGPPGKPMVPPKAKEEPKGKAEAKALPKPFHETAKPVTKEEISSKKPHKKTAAEKREEEQFLTQGPGAPPQRREEREGGHKQQDQKMVVDVSNLPPFATHIQPAAVAAAQQAMPYLNPATIPLFFQMVGTIYALSATPGVSRTQIVLNNPSYARSRFFGATITIEKYATAPDSFNIRLSGSDAAVTAFKENIPNLVTAFQNGNFNFRVNRLEADYTLDRPVFLRKDKGEERGDAGGGDLGERRK